MKAFLLSMLTFCVLGLPGSTARALPVQVKDINTTLTGGTYLWPFSTEFVNVNGVAYFPVSDGVHGLELWRSDGTGAGTRLVHDICPGACSGLPRWLTVAGTTLYFSADDGAHGPELWKSDGTDAGTVLVQDILPGLAGSNPNNLFELGGPGRHHHHDRPHGPGQPPPLPRRHPGARDEHRQLHVGEHPLEQRDRRDRQRRSERPRQPRGRQRPGSHHPRCDRVFPVADHTGPKVV
jgi:ELWxxDGT repeat protein